MRFVLNDLDLGGFATALAGANPTPTALLKLHAATHARWADSMDVIRDVKQVTRGVRDAVQAQGELKRLTLVERREADDGFVKYLFESPLGGQFEAVRIPIFDEKYVVCISSQVGCALACDFCATGRLGFSRNLSAWEMVDQVQWVKREVQRPVRGIVFMGMGEPLLNYANATRAARIFCHPAGLAIDAKSITFSTAGWVPGIRKFTQDRLPYRLAFSITSAIPEKRAQVLPVEKTYPLPELVDAIREYATTRNERAMLAYVLIKGFNTGREDAEALKALFDGIPIKMDLIDVTDLSGKYEPPDDAERHAFFDALQILKSPIARRYSGGKDIGAACGTLAGTRSGGNVMPASPPSL